MTSSAAGHINFLHSNFKVKVVYGIAWLKAKGPFVARLGVSRIRQQGGSFLSVHAREKVSGGVSWVHQFTSCGRKETTGLPDVNREVAPEMKL